MKFTTFVSILLASAVTAAPAPDKMCSRNELGCCVGDMACTGLVARDLIVRDPAKMCSRNELGCCVGDMACTGLAARALAARDPTAAPATMCSRNELGCCVGDMACTGVSIPTPHAELG